MAQPPENVAADDVIDALRADYDATPYTSNSFPQSAPGKLAAVAYLFGLETPPVTDARVLEVGCAGGGNVIPFAAANPGAHVVGIDLSPVQIEQGRARAQQLGLANVELIAGDIADMDIAALGQFDYVIAHGVYSWVPPEVQEAVLAACRRLLAPDGVAYVSYNVYPGWKSKEVVRDAMLLASGATSSPADRAREAREMADFLEEVAPADGVMARVLVESRAFADGFGDSYLLHDELETFNAPCYFYEMLSRTGAHGLAYLAEARPEVMIPGNYGPRVAEHLLQKCGNVQVLVEQYLDFVANRMFRESLFVHADRAAHIRYSPGRDRFARMHVAAWLPPANEPTRLDNSRQEFRQSDGATLFTNDPGIKAALDVLSARWPWTTSRDELITAVRTRLEAAGLAPSSNLPDHVDNLMGVLILQGQADYRLEPVRPEVSGGPLRLDETARRMAELTRADGDACTFNAWHETLILSPVDRHLLPLLDGTRDREALLAGLLESLAGTPITVESDELAEHVDALPEHLAEMKLIRLS